MSDTNVPYLRIGEAITDEKGVPLEWFRNAFNSLVQRTGTQTENTILGVVNGAAQARADAAAAQAAADAAAAAAAAAAAGTSGSSSFYATSNRYAATGTTTTSGAVTTNSVTVTPTGGTGPYTYAWAYVSGDAVFTATSPAAATTTFSGSVAAGEDKTAVWSCTITDSLAATAAVSIGVSISSLS